MISKIIKIKGVGKFRDYSSSGSDDLRFLKRTIIFGYNTYGKSTLTAVFRSLANSDQQLLKGRKSFNFSGKSEIDILDGNNKHLTLSNGNWHEPNIIIFDNKFIQDFVFLGDQIDIKHKASLHGIFVGENIREKVINLNKLRNEQANIETARDKVKNKYNRSDLGSFEEFLKAEVVDNVGEKIIKKNAEITQLENISVLKIQIQKTPLSKDFQNFVITMRKTLDTSAEENIENHIKNHWKNGDASRNFISEGVALLKDDTKNCVFCGQNLKSVVGLIEDFKNVFGDIYKKTQSEIETAGETFLHFDPEAEIAKLLPLGINCEELLDKEVLLDNKAALDAEINLKLKNLNHTIDFDSEDNPFKYFLNEVVKLRPIFKEINEKEFSDQEIKILMEQLKKLQLAQYRHSNEGINLEKEYSETLKELRDKKKEISELRNDIDQETKQTINNNEAELNNILKDKLKAEFTIQKLTSRSNLTRSRSHYVDYEFVFDGNVIPLSNKNSQYELEPKEEYYFGNTLSDSDRRLLAMAIFITRLQTDKSLSKKIVVLDDPFSSFDSNRKDYLAKAIIDVKNQQGEEPDQMIVLTHDDSFLARLQDKLPKTGVRYLQIKNSSVSGSSLDICDVQKVIEEEYFKDVRFIKDAADNTINIDDALRRVRKCLERILRHKYYFSLDTKTLDEGSISAYLVRIDNKCIVKDEILENDWHEHMHDQHEIMKLSEPEKIQKLKDFLVLLEKI